MVAMTNPTKCVIKNIDSGDELEAMFNPGELTISKTVPWNKHDDSKGDTPRLEFTKADPLELDVELFFDTYEFHTSVVWYVHRLQSFTMVMEDKMRPPMVSFIWGDKFPKFVGVITSLTTKYSMFFSDGMPCRATCTIKMKQAEIADLGEEAKPEGEDQRWQSAPGQTVQQGDEMRADKLGDDHRAALDRNGSEDGTLSAGQQAHKG